MTITKKDIWKAVVFLAVVVVALLALNYYMTHRRGPFDWLKTATQEQLTHCDKYNFPRYNTKDMTGMCEKLKTGDHVYNLVGAAYEPDPKQFKFDEYYGSYFPSSYDAAGVEAAMVRAGTLPVSESRFNTMADALKYQK